MQRSAIRPTMQGKRSRGKVQECLQILPPKKMTKWNLNLSSSKFWHQRGERVDQLFPFHPGFNRYRLEGGNEVIWPGNTCSWWISMRYNFWEKIQQRPNDNKWVLWKNIKMYLEYPSFKLVLNIITWKKWIVSPPEECTFCKSTVWCILLGCWFLFGFQWTSLRSVRQISWNYRYKCTMYRYFLATEVFGAVWATEPSAR